MGKNDQNFENPFYNRPTHVNEIVIITIVSSVLFFGFLLYLIAYFKVKNFEKKK